MSKIFNSSKPKYNLRLHIVIIIVLFISFGCVKGRENMQFSPEYSFSNLNGMETLIFSDPQNYSMTLDKSEATGKVEIRSSEEE